MTTINLKDFYAWYTHDEYIEVFDEAERPARSWQGLRREWSSRA